MDGTLDTTFRGELEPNQESVGQALQSRGSLRLWIETHPKAALSLIMIMSIPYLLTCLGMTLLFVIQAAGGGCGG